MSYAPQIQNRTPTEWPTAGGPGVMRQTILRAREGRQTPKRKPQIGEKRPRHLLRSASKTQKQPC